MADADRTTTVRRPWYRTWRVPAVLFAVAGAVLAWAYVREPAFDQAAKFLFIVSTMGGATVLSSTWFCFLGPASRRFRIRYFVAATAFCLLLVGLFKIEGTSGNLWPSVRWRFHILWVGGWCPIRLVATQSAHYGLEGARELAEAARAAQLSAQSSALPGLRDYPGFLGENRTPVVTGIHLARDWKQHPPKLLWRQPIGAGWSAFAVAGDIAVTQEQRGNEELVVAYDVATGKVVWVHADPGLFEAIVGGDGPRATPTIHEGRVYTLGATGWLNCLDLKTGEPIWPTRNVLTDAHTTAALDAGVVRWGRAASPLIVDRLIIVPLGGNPEDRDDTPAGKNGRFTSLAGYDRDTGNLLVRGGQRQISYSSPSLVTIAGQRQVVIVNEASITGHDPASLAVLWEIDWDGSSSSSASAPQTVPVDGDTLFVSKGYSIGSMLFRIQKGKAGALTAESIWHKTNIMKTKFSNVAMREGYVYGIADNILECAEVATGDQKWRNGRYGEGQLLMADDLLIIQAESGEVALVEASPQRFHELGRFAALEDNTGITWNNPALAGRYLLVRNAQQAACYELPVEPDK